jgi:hypothetical protein
MARAGRDSPRCGVAGVPLHHGRSGGGRPFRRILVFGGDGGTLFRELEAHDLAVAGLRAKLKEPTSTAAERTGWERQVAVHLEAKRRIYLNHPGFSRDVLEYDSRPGSLDGEGDYSLAPASHHSGRALGG